jgi:hypothetical protein
MDITSIILKGLLIFIILFLSFLIVWNINQNYFNKNQFLEGMEPGVSASDSVSNASVSSSPSINAPSIPNPPSTGSSTSSLGPPIVSPPSTGSSTSSLGPPIVSPPSTGSSTSSLGPPIVSPPSAGSSTPPLKPPPTNPITTQLADNINTGLQTATDVVKLIDNNKLNDFYNAIKHKNLPNLGIQPPNNENVGSNVTKYNF